MRLYKFLHEKMNSNAWFNEYYFQIDYIHNSIIISDKQTFLDKINQLFTISIMDNGKEICYFDKYSKTTDIKYNCLIRNFKIDEFLK